MRRLLRYTLRPLLVVLLLLDVKLFVFLVFPTDRFWESNLANWLQIGMGRQATTVLSMRGNNGRQLGAPPGDHPAAPLTVNQREQVERLPRS